MRVYVFIDLEGRALGFGVAPEEEAVFAAGWIMYHRHLPGEVKEIRVDEEIHVREEDAESGMRVVPADDALVGVIAVHDAVDVVPGVGGEGDLGGGVAREFAADAVFDDEEVAGVVADDVADEDAADFDVAGGVAVLVDRVEDGALDDRLEAGAARADGGGPGEAGPRFGCLVGGRDVARVNPGRPG